MERRTFLKGILGAAAAAFRPALTFELFPNQEDPFTICMKEGFYLLRASCMVELPPGNAHHQLEIRCSGTTIGGGEVVTCSPDPFLSHITVQMTAALRAGDRLHLRCLRNGVEYKPKSQVELWVMAMSEANHSLKPSMPYEQGL